MENLKLDHKSEIAEEFFTLGPEQIHQIYPTPTLIHLKGKNPEALFISTLLHGNETTGFYALQRFLANFKSELPPRDLYILIGNTAAARSQVRHLPHQLDFNRIWHDSSHPLTSAVEEVLASGPIAACVDIHNTTGMNPPYSVIHRLDDRCLAFAQMFSSNIIYFEQPKEALSVALSRRHLAITIECGLSTNADSVHQVLEFLNRLSVLNISELEMTQRPDVYESFGRIFIPEKAHFAFDSVSHVDLSIVSDIEKYNFVEIKPGTLVGHYFSDQRLQLMDVNNSDIGDSYFDYNNGEIRLKQAVTPSLLTSDPQVVRQDVLGYLMNPVR
jgi:succinylglutamate desuccinylase